MKNTNYWNQRTSIQSEQLQKMNSNNPKRHNEMITSLTTPRKNNSMNT